MGGGGDRRLRRFLAEVGDARIDRLVRARRADRRRLRRPLEHRRRGRARRRDGRRGGLSPRPQPPARRSRPRSGAGCAGSRRWRSARSASNPFPDSTPEFFAGLEALLDQAMGGRAPADPAVRGAPQGRGPAPGRHLPLHLTFSCIDPSTGSIAAVATSARSGRGLPRRRAGDLTDYGADWHATCARTAPDRRGMTPNTMYRVTREIAFCYGHRLLNYDGKCRHLHGHNGRAVDHARGPGLDATRDARGLRRDQAAGPALDRREPRPQHAALPRRPAAADLRERGERVFVMDENPTAENIARLIFESARAGLPVVEVVLWETDQCCSSYVAWGVDACGRSAGSRSAQGWP